MQRVNFFNNIKNGKLLWYKRNTVYSKKNLIFKACLFVYLFICWFICILFDLLLCQQLTLEFKRGLVTFWELRR